ncbi:MAG TPA: cyclic nucleotide-binding domain-containing protein [Candidatus Acidoferrales bacterium]|jgi:CRP-like cAMP-binding protein/Pyruvate/2-oxoacid:ferredoxin oxidoreductase delta subunit|nr:cyclic nucleotide-binding domain-containing protein [Candidatus Acidoferrales bacterium]
MAKDVILAADLGGDRLTADELAGIPDFAGIRKEIWDKFPGAIARKQYSAGEILMREGENGTTAFYILSGTIELFINNPVSHVESSRKSAGNWFGGLTKITNYVKGIPAPKAATGHGRTHIPIDASVDLPMENPIAEVTAGDLIGELAALAALKQERLKRPKFYPRSATARAKTDIVVLEMLPNILNNVLYNAAAFKEKLNRNYRFRALDSHLRSVPIFRNLSPDFLEHLRDRVELVDAVPGQVICRQGEIADSFYLIRMGFVKVSQVFPGGELVLTYLSRSSYFGEMGLLPPVFRVRAKGPKPGNIAEAAVSSAELTLGRAPNAAGALAVHWDEYISREHATMRVEGKQLRVSRLVSGKNPITFRMKPVETALVSPGETFVIGETTFEIIEEPLQSGRRTTTCTAVDFVQLVRIKAEDFAQMLERFPEVESGIKEVARARRQMDLQLLGRVQQASLSSFLEQELMQGQNLLLLDLDKCTRCDECVKACVATHNDGVTRLVRDGLRFENFLVATSCRACMDPLCMTQCPVGAIRRKDSLDIVIEDWCIGCGNCARDCPYGNINVVQVAETNRKQKAEAKPKAVVCDLCAEFPEPNCVRACPHDAAIRVEPKTFFARDLAGKQLIVPASAPAPLPAAPERSENIDTKIYSNVGELLNMLPRLKIVSGPRSGTFLQLRFPTTTFGRSADNDYRFADDTVMSRTQAVILCELGRFVLRDLNSTNGTMVNANAVTEIDLHPGDIIEMGEMQMEFLGGQVQ